MRLFNVLLNETGNLSGRDLLWPSFEDAAAQSPWFGWGVGAGNVVIPPDGRIAQILHTWAAHNEYLRIEVEGGMDRRGTADRVVRGWVIVRTRRLAGVGPADHAAGRSSPSPATPSPTTC